MNDFNRNTSKHDVRGKKGSIVSKDKKSKDSMAIGMSIGIALGLVFGMLFDNLALGLAIGLSIGIGIGSAKDNKKE
ncbi:hypothetical protein J9303_14795 [Bacillaceae bacterium Marseille-Q3522]|nr:hypothetical protein [Bacillaceae bacterium Marseille-Q3522]